VLAVRHIGELDVHRVLLDEPHFSAPEVELLNLA
jgi:hypothetical protein